MNTQTKLVIYLLPGIIAVAAIVIASRFILGKFIGDFFAYLLSITIGIKIGHSYYVWLDNKFGTKSPK